MNSEYEVSVDGANTIKLNTADLEKFDIQRDGSRLHIIHNGHPISIEILNSDFHNRSYTLLIGKQKYSVSIARPIDLKIASMGFDTSKGAQVNQVKAPMPGLILEVSIKAGQAVKENDPLLILEAMKMENVLIAPRDGVIKSVCCSKGDAVEKTQLLIEFES